MKLLILDNYPYKESRYATKQGHPTRREVLEYLCHIYEKCYWCGKKVKSYGRIFRKGEIIPDDFATVDHIISIRFRKKGERVEKVLSCRVCNENRAKEEDKKYGDNPPSPHSL